MTSSGVADMDFRDDKPSEQNFELAGNAYKAPVELTHDEERALKKTYVKLDAFFLTIVTALYWLNFLDRANIGNARAAGMQTQLGLSNYEYSICLTTTYISFLFAEWPAVMIAKKFGFNQVLPLLCIAWGLCTTFQGFVTSYGGLVAARFFLGACEGAILPGCVTYLSEFYRRRDLGKRMVFFFSAIALAGAFSGLLAAAILNLEGKGGKAGWRWIFFVEGAMTVVLGAIFFFCLPRNIDTCKYLRHEEKELLHKAMASEGLTKASDDVFSWHAVLSALKSPQAILMTLIFFPAGATLFAIAYFTPTVVAGLGYTGITIQLMSVPPYFCAFVLSLITSYFSDRTRLRGPFLMLWTLIAIVGYAMWLGTSNTKVLYGAIVLQISGIYSVAGIFGVWNSNNLSPSYKRATGIVMGFVTTNLGGILSTWLFPTTDAPRYIKGTSILLGLACVMAILIVLNFLYLTAMNRKKATARAQGRDNFCFGDDDRRLDFEYIR